MAKKPTASKTTIKKQTIAEMNKLGVYKPQYHRIIEIYAELVAQYLKISKEFEEGGYKFKSFTGDGGEKKAPVVATLENLRKDILAYSDRLCLNPKALETVTVENKKQSTLAKALSELK